MSWGLHFSSPTRGSFVFFLASAYFSKNPRGPNDLTVATQPNKQINCYMAKLFQTGIT